VEKCVGGRHFITTGGPSVASSKDAYGSDRCAGGGFLIGGLLGTVHGSTRARLGPGAVQIRPTPGGAVLAWAGHW